MHLVSGMKHNPASAFGNYLIDASYRRNGAPEVISVRRIIERGYSPEYVRAWLKAEAESIAPDDGTYRGSDGSGGMWRVRISFE